MGNIMDTMDCTGGERKSPPVLRALEDDPTKKFKPLQLPRTPSPDSMQNPQEVQLQSPMRHRSSMELLDYLTDSAHKTKSMRSANLDDAYANDLITDEEYAAKMRDLNLSTYSSHNNTALNTSGEEEEEEYVAPRTPLRNKVTFQQYVEEH